MVDRGGSAHGEQPASQALGQDQRALRGAGGGAGAPGPGESAAGGRADQHPGRPAPAGRGLPAQHRGLAQLSRPAQGIAGNRVGSRREAGWPGALLALPGRCRGGADARLRSCTTTGRRLPAWPAVALDELEAARAQEGQVMAEELQSLGRSIESSLGRIADRGPLVVQSYQKRLTERIGALVQDQGVTVEPKDLIREVAILADRSDISEEIVRLRAHLVQYQEILATRRAPGASSSSSSRRWAARSTRSGPRPATSRSAVTWLRSRVFWRKSGSSCRMWSDCEVLCAGG